MKTEKRSMPVALFLAGLIFISLSACSNGKSDTDVSTVQAGNTRPMVNFVDENNDGICDNTGRRMPLVQNNKNRPNFVDADNDGICDRTGRRISRK